MPVTAYKSKPTKKAEHLTGAVMTLLISYIL